jgi:polyphosphate glucokinase
VADNVVMGVDIGGTGIKGAPVDIEKGELAGERFRILTPHPATPKAVADVVGEVVEHFTWNGPVGATFPAAVKDGVTLTAANVDQEWIGTNADELFTQRLNMPVTVLNDADAAGLAEMRHGAGRGVPGVVLTLTLGTGIGSGLFTDGTLVPNTEFGHLEIDGHDAETQASEAAREREQLTWTDWAHRVELYLRRADALLWPDLVILGGGASKKADRWLPLLDVRPELAVAVLRNAAGVVGAAMACAEYC